LNTHFARGFTAVHRITETSCIDVTLFAELFPNVLFCFSSNSR